MVLLAAILTDNILLTNFLGMCSFLAVSGRMQTALGMGAAVTFVMTFTTGINHVLYHAVLVPLGLEYLTLIVFIAVIAGFVQLAEMVIERLSPALHQRLGVFLPLITVNCAILGGSLFMVLRRYDLLSSLCFGFGGGLGYALAIVAMAGARLRLRHADVPKPLQGLAISLIVTALMAMAFMGFAGIVNVQ